MPNAEDRRDLAAAADSAMETLGLSVDDDDRIVMAPDDDATDATPDATEEGAGTVDQAQGDLNALVQEIQGRGPYGKALIEHAGAAHAFLSNDEYALQAIVGRLDRNPALWQTLQQVMESRQMSPDLRWMQDDVRKISQHTLQQAAAPYVARIDALERELAALRQPQAQAPAQMPRTSPRISTGRSRGASSEEPDVRKMSNRDAVAWAFEQAQRSLRGGR